MIVVFGSINLDLVARVARLPHAGETLHGHAFATSPGGKGANQALAARRAGAEVALFGAAGTDAFAAPALTLLAAEGVDLAGVSAIDGATGVALIHVDDAGENAITVVAGANGKARAAAVPDAVLGPGTTLLLQLETPPAESLALARRARTRGARVILNAAPVAPLDGVWLDAIDVLVVNDTEAKALVADFGADATTLAKRHAMAVIVTLGREGAVAIADDVRYVVPALQVLVVDTVGAGDAFVGVLAAALDRGARWPAALAQAGAAGALACTRESAQASLPDARAIAKAASGLESRVQTSPLNRQP